MACFGNTTRILDKTASQFNGWGEDSGIPAEKPVFGPNPAQV